MSNYLLESLQPQYNEAVKRWAGFELKDIIHNEKSFLCGGFLRAITTGNKPSDMDFYCETPEQAEKLISGILLSGHNYDVVFKSENAVTLQRPHNYFNIQVINAIYGNISEILDQFDFTITKIGIFYAPGDGFKLVYHNDFYKHLAKQELSYTGSAMPLSSLKRVLKYIRKGYDICDENLLKIVDDIRALNVETNEGITYNEAEWSPSGRKIRPID